MEQTVYLDLLFMINFSMDFLCFYIASKIMAVKFPVLRVCVASVIGGIYADAALFLPTHRLFTLALDIALCLVICAISFGRKHGLIFSTLVYFSVSMALGGVMTAIFNLLNRMGFGGAVLEEGQGDGISVWLLAFLAVVSAVMTLLGGKFFKKSSSVRRVGVELAYKGKKTELGALVDTGNLLCEPISGRACIVVDTLAVRELFPERLTALAKSAKPYEITLLGDELIKDVRLLPARAATGEGMMIAVRPERVCIDTGRKKYEVDAMIALGDLGGGGSREKALVPSELLR